MTAVVIFFHQRLEERPVGVEEPLDATVVLRAAALDHVGGECPRRAGETEERTFTLQFRFDAGQRLADVSEARGSAGGVQPVDLSAGLEREIHGDAAFLAKLVALAQRLGDDEDVGEDDRRIEREAAQRLQRDFRGQFRRAYHFEEGVLRLQRAVFRQVATGLAHDPNRRTVERFAGAGGEETFATSHGLIGHKKSQKATKRVGLFLCVFVTLRS